MRKLLLVKHAPPLVQPDVPPERWVLSEKGRGLCENLAQALRPHELAAIVSSVEPKAAETGQIVAARLGITFETAPDLHEHDRGNVPHVRSGEFISMMELFFRRPAERVLGRESADAALARFSKAIDAALAKQAQGNVSIVSHGTVIALFAARHGGGNGFELWRRMGLPSFVVMELPGYAPLQTVNAVVG